MRERIWYVPDLAPIWSTDAETFESGSGACLRAGSASSYAAVTSTISQPAGYSTPTTMPGDLASGFVATATIPVP